MIMFVLCASLMVAVMLSAKKQERLNIPALVSIEAALLLPVFAWLFDLIAQNRVFSPAAFRSAFLAVVPVVFLAALAGGVVGIIKHLRDRSVGGLGWSMLGPSVALLVGCIVGSNVIAGAQSTGIQRLRQENEQQIRQMRERRQILACPPSMTIYFPADCSFSVTMPKGIESQSPSQIFDGKVAIGTLRSVIARDSKKQVTCALVWVESLPGAPDTPELDRMAWGKIGARVCTLFKDQVAEITGETAFDGDDFDGVDRWNSTHKGYVITEREYATNDGQYELAIYAPAKESASSSAVTGFFDSFKIEGVNMEIRSRGRCR